MDRGWEKRGGCVSVCYFMSVKLGRYDAESVGFRGEGVFPDTARRRPHEKENACMGDIFGSSKCHWCVYLRLLVRLTGYVYNGI